jgi:hypothetical protein
MKKLLGIVLSLLALALPAQAQSTWETPQTATGGPTVTGGVGLCLNGSGLAVPCGASTPTYVYPGTGALWTIGTGVNFIGQVAINDGTHGPAAVKAASTAAATTDPALVVQISPEGVGSASTPLSVVSNQSVGSGSFATAQASPGVAATLIAAARTGVSGTGRIAAIITNMSTVPVFLGVSGVTTTTGSYLAGVVGAAVVIPTTAAIYGVVGSGTGSVSVQELY